MTTTVSMTAAEVSAVLNECGLKHGGVIAFQGGFDVHLESDSDWTYDSLVKVAARLGTTDIRFRWTSHPGYSEDTPGDPDDVWMEIRGVALTAPASTTLA